MELQHFIENFANQFSHTPFNEFTPETVFKQLAEWSSLTALSVMIMTEEEYDVKLKGDDLRKASTVDDLFRMIEKMSQK
jgi:acyl carrier protein